MAMAFPARRSAQYEPSVEPNVIPFIDVLLVLLVIFMVTAPKPTVDLQLELPVRGTVIPVTIPPMIIDLRAAPGGYAIFIGDRELGLAELPGVVLAQSLAVDPVLNEADVFAEARVYVRATDQGIAYGAVVAVLDELKSAGFEKVGVFAQAADEEA